MKMRVEAELRSIEKKRAILVVRVLRLPDKRLWSATFSSSQITQLAKRFLLRDAKSEKHFVTLAKRLFLQKRREIELRLAKGKKLSFQWIPPNTKKGRPLNGFEHILFLPGMGLPPEKRSTSSPKNRLSQKNRQKGDSLWFRYRKSFNGYTSVMMLESKDKKLQWPIFDNIPYPKGGYVHRIIKLKDWRWVELEYDSGRKWAPRSTYTFFLKPLPAAARLYNLKGYKLHDEKKYRKAMKAFKRAISLDHKYGDAVYNLACTYAKLKLRSETLFWLRRSIVLDASYRKYACTDADFASLKHLPAWKKIVDCKANDRQKKAKKKKVTQKRPNKRKNP